MVRAHCGNHCHKERLCQRPSERAIGGTKYHKQKTTAAQRMAVRIRYFHRFCRVIPDGGKIGPLFRLNPIESKSAIAAKPPINSSREPFSRKRRMTPTAVKPTRARITATVRWRWSAQDKSDRRRCRLIDMGLLSAEVSRIVRATAETGKRETGSLEPKKNGSAARVAVHGYSAFVRAEES